MEVYKSVESKKSNKIGLDKYYTSPDTANYVVYKTLQKIGFDKITEIIEPSAGNGSFIPYLKCLDVNQKYYDIEPEHKDIKKQDYLKLDENYKKGRLIIGNPPFGSRLALAKKFFKKSVEIADYISFILPSSQLNNINSMFEFDLIYSVNLGNVTFSDNRKVPCCLNIYARPLEGLNKRISNKLKEISIVRSDSKKYKDFDFDIRICGWGNGSAGKILKDNEKYALEYKIKILNSNKKDEIIFLLSNIDWKKELNSVSMLKIQQHHIHTLIKNNVKDII